MNQRYAPHKVFMSNVVKSSGCRPLFRKRRRMPFWLYAGLHAFGVCLLVVILFFASLLIILEALGQ